MKPLTELSQTAIVKKTATLSMTGLLAVPFIASLSFSAFAGEIDGAWASDASVCSKVFVKNDNKMSFAPNAELYGGGFIVEGTRVTGTFQKCKITSTKNDGKSIHLIAACSDGVMVQETQFTVRFVETDKISLTSVGFETLENPFVRCQP